MEIRLKLTALLLMMVAQTHSAYIFTYFKDATGDANGLSGLHLAYSNDGKTFTDITGDNPLYLVGDNATPQPFPLMSYASKNHENEIFRDPSLSQDGKGTFYLTWSAHWESPFFAYATSTDLIHWSLPKIIALKNVDAKNIVYYTGLPIKSTSSVSVPSKDFQHRFQTPVPANAIINIADWPDATTAWAPEIIYIPELKQFFVTWATKTKEKQHKMYYALTADFKTFCGPYLLFEPGYDVIDSTIINAGTDAAPKYYLIFKDERQAAVDGGFLKTRKNFKIAEGSDKPWGPYINIREISDTNYTEGPSIIKIGDTFKLYYDRYAQPQKYGVLESTDLINWKPGIVNMPAGARHGSILEVDSSVVEGLKAFVAKLKMHFQVK